MRQPCFGLDFGNSSGEKRKEGLSLLHIGKLVFFHDMEIIRDQRNQRCNPGSRVREADTGKGCPSGDSHDNSGTGNKFKNPAKHGYKSISHTLKRVAIQENAAQERIGPEYRFEISDRNLHDFCF